MERDPKTEVLMRQIEQMARGEVSKDVFSALQVFDPGNLVYLTNHLPPVELWEAFDKIKPGKAFLAAHPDAKRLLGAKVYPLTNPTQEEWVYYERWAKEAERQNPSPPVLEEEVKPLNPLPLLFESDDEERKKAAEFRQAMKDAGIDTTVFNSGKKNSINSLAVRKLQEWFGKRVSAINCDAAFRFLTQSCKLSCTVAGRTWPTALKKWLQ